MPFNVANALQLNLPDPIGIDQLKRRNALADRDQQLQESNALAQQDYWKAQQENIATDNNRLAAADAEKKQEEGRKIALSYAENLATIQDPAQFQQAAAQAAADPRVQALGINLAQITPDNVRSFLAQARGAAGQAPPVQLETVGDINNPSQGIWQRNPVTGETKQVTAPHYASQSGGRPSPPSGYQWNPDGTLGPIPGGPSDPNNPKNDRADLKQEQSLRKEFEGLDSVKKFQETLPLLVSARKAPNNGYGDLQLIYTAGKILDPGSVVREGELALTIAAGSPLQRILGQTQFTIEKGGRLTPKTRQQILGMLNERVLAYRQGYDRDYTRYADYGAESGFVPRNVVGTHAANAYRQPQAPQGAPKRVRVDAQGNVIGN